MLQNESAMSGAGVWARYGGSHAASTQISFHVSSKIKSGIILTGYRTIRVPRRSYRYEYGNRRGTARGAGIDDRSGRRVAGWYRVHVFGSHSNADFGDPLARAETVKM